MCIACVYAKCPGIVMSFGRSRGVMSCEAVVHLALCCASYCTLLVLRNLNNWAVRARFMFDRQPILHNNSYIFAAYPLPVKKISPV